MIAFILAGGKGKRLEKITGGRIPKPMVKLSGKPVLQYQMEFLARNNVNNVVVSVGDNVGIIKKYFGDGQSYGLSIKYSTEPRPLGTAGAFKYAEPFFAHDQDILVLYGDIIFDIDLKRLTDFYHSSGGLGTLLVHPNDHPYDSDLLEVDSSNKITRFIFKPHPADEAYQNLVNAGIYVLKPDVADFIQSGQKLDFGKNIFPALVDDGKDLYAYRSSEYVRDIGLPERYKEAAKDIISGKVYRRNLMNTQKALFIDRDGVINEEVNYLCKPEQLKMIDGSADAVRKINESDYLSVIVSNQSAVARGLCSEKDINEIHKKLDSLLGQGKAFLDGIYYCPHHPDSGFPEENKKYKTGCTCRKPGTGMIEKAQNDFHIDREKSFMIGDSTVDIMTGMNAGMKTVLVRTGYAGKDRRYDVFPDFIFENLKEAVDFIVDDYETLNIKINNITAPFLSKTKNKYVVSVGGLSRSGKSTIARVIAYVLNEKGFESVILSLDDWLVDLQHRETWMDVRDRYDYKQIEKDIRLLLAGSEIQVQKYDAETRQKAPAAETLRLDNQRAIIIEGVVALDIPSLRDISDCKIYVDIDEAVREKRFNDSYRHKGLEQDEIEVLYGQRQVDEVPVILKSKQFADHIVAV